MAGPEFEKSWQARYDQWAERYREDYQIAGWSHEGLSRRLALVLRLINALRLKPRSLLLDLGAGPGTYTRAIANIGHRCLGLDYSKKVLEVARSKGKRETYIQGEAYHLPFRSGVFDAVLCIGVLQSLEQPVRALNEIARILTPGGHILLDGLNSLFWMHRLRSWKEFLSGSEKRMNYMNPYVVLKEAKRVGLFQDGLYWLAVPRICQKYAPESPGLASFFFAPLAGHAFLFHGKKKK